MTLKQPGPPGGDRIAARVVAQNRRHGQRGGGRRIDAREIRAISLSSVGPDWIALLPGITLWALALYLPLSLPLSRLEQTLAAGSLDGDLQQLLLVLASLALALAVGTLTDLALGWALGPGWATSLGLMAAGWGLFTALASRARNNGE